MLVLNRAKKIVP